MKEKIIQGGIVNGVKMLVCPTWEEDFQTEIHKTGGCLRISMELFGCRCFLLERIGRDS